MPELPEVESIRRGLARAVRGDVIASVWLGEKPEPLKSPAPEIVAALEQARIAAVRRVGKHIVFDLTRAAAEGGRATWIVHLGMTGQLLVARPESELAKHTHAIVKLESGRELRFVDPRRFGRLSVVREGGFTAAGREPLGASAKQFAALFRGRKTPIKSALLNQALLRGVGNIYADESLHRAGIRPRRRAGRLTQEELKRLHRALQQVLRAAIRAGGSSVSDYVNAEGDAGFFQFEHRVYGREGRPCRRCRTPITRVVISGRSAHYCPKCQK